MATCTYTFKDQSGESVTLAGIPALKAYLVMGGLEQLMPDAPSFNNDLVEPVRFSIADTIRDTTQKVRKQVDSFTESDRAINSLSDLDHALSTGTMPQKKVNMQNVLDKIATLLVDSSRPFDAPMRDIPGGDSLILPKDRAKRRVAIMEKEAMDKFMRPLAKVIGQIAKDHNFDYRTVKDVVGRWMSMRYAIEKNGDFIEQDKQAIRDAEKSLNDAISDAQEKVMRNELDAVPNFPDLRSAITRAKSKQTKREEAINKPEVIDPTLTSLDIGLAGGYNNFTAQHYMDAIESKIPRNVLEEAAQHVYDMMGWKVKRDLQNGKVTQESYDKWFKSPYYVPLTGDPRSDESTDELFAHGSVNQSADQRALGRSESLAQGGIDAAIEQVQKSARYHGWVDFKDALMKLYDNLIEQEINDGATMREAQQTVLEKYKLSRSRLTDMFVPETGITVRKGNDKWVYDFHNEEAINALKSLNKEDVPSILKPVAAFTRGYARLVTQFLPGFGAINAIRDVWERSENIRTRTLPGYESIDMDSVAREAIKTAAHPVLVKKLMSLMLEGTILRGKFPVDETDVDIKMMREMIAEGATSTVGDYLSSTSETLSKQMQKTLHWSTETLELVNAWNNGFELVSSYSIYKALRDAGVDKKTAAGGTLNLMNFGKQGTITGPLKALYTFVNPTMQGGHQLIQTLSTRKGKARAMAYMLTGMSLYAMLRAIAGDDDDTGENKLDSQSNFIIERNIMIPIGDHYIKIPIGFGITQAAWGAAVNVDKAIFGNQSVADSAMEIVKSFARTMAPVSPSEASIANHPIVWATQTFTPQIVKPIMNVGLDVNTFGQPLTNSRFGREDKALALQGRKTTPDFYKDVAEVLGGMGINMYPEQVKEIIRGYAVGPFNELMKATVENPNKEKLGRESVPFFIDRFVAVNDTGGLKDRLYYTYRDEMNEAAVAKSLGKTLTPRQRILADLQVQVKRLEGKANGKMAAYSKTKNEMFKKQSEKIRENTHRLVFSKVKLLPE